MKMKKKVNQIYQIMIQKKRKKQELVKEGIRIKKKQTKEIILFIPKKISKKSRNI